MASSSPSLCPPLQSTVTQPKSPEPHSVPLHLPAIEPAPFAPTLSSRVSPTLSVHDPHALSQLRSIHETSIASYSNALLHRSMRNLRHPSSSLAVGNTFCVLNHAVEAFKTQAPSSSSPLSSFLHPKLIKRQTRPHLKPINACTFMKAHFSFLLFRKQMSSLPSQPS